MGTNRIDEVARRIAAGVDRRTLLAGFAALAAPAPPAAGAARVAACAIPECVDACPNLDCYRDPAGACVCVIIDRCAGLCAGCCAGERCHPPGSSRRRCGVGGVPCRICRRGKTCRPDGRCRRAPGRPRHR